MDQGFVCTYSDVLYRGELISKLLAHPGDIVLGVDTDWHNLYIGRTEHPESDGEKVSFEGDKLIHIHSNIFPGDANGEYTGVAKFSARGAQLFKQHYFRVKEAFTQRPWREAKVFEKAYKILLFQEMLERGVEMNVVCIDGGYIEVDTIQDYEYALANWN